MQSKSLQPAVVFIMLLCVSMALTYLKLFPSIVKPAQAALATAVTTATPPRPVLVTKPTVADDSVLLTATQLKSVALQSVANHDFSVSREAVGNIDFNADRLVPVSSAYQGRVIQVMANAADIVRKGQALMVIDSPDLVQAESTYISALGTQALSTRAMARAKALYELQSLAQKDYEQTVSDQQVADASLKAARDGLRIFGKSSTEIDRIGQLRLIDGRLTVASPIAGRVTAKNIAAGMFIQPGVMPAPFTVADVSSKWMLANVAESDVPVMRLGQDVEVRVMAYPGRVFHGRISNIGAGVDPNTHRVLVRSEIRDEKNELSAQMLANFVVHTGQTVTTLAIPANGLVHEGDGTKTVWVTRDMQRFTRRLVEIGMQQNGLYQVVSGLQAGELVAGEGALFISNARILNKG